MGQSDRGPSVDWWGRQGFAARVRTSQTTSREQVSRQWEQHESSEAGKVWKQEDRWPVWQEERE